MAKAVEETANKQAEENFDLFGSFRFKVDAKGRVALPAKLRKALPKDLVVTCEPQNRCAYVFKPAGFDDWVDQLFDARFDGYDAADPLHVMLQSKLMGNADSVEVDSSGRIPLKQDIRENVGITKDVVLIGNRDRLEIWDAQNYDAAFAEVDLGIFYK